MLYMYLNEYFSSLFDYENDIYKFKMRNKVCLLNKICWVEVWIFNREDYVIFNFIIRYGNWGL